LVITEARFSAPAISSFPRRIDTCALRSRLSSYQLHPSAHK
jgi:type VI protein secretion system component VasA